MKNLMIRFLIALALVVTVVALTLGGARPEFINEAGVVMRVPRLMVAGFEAKLGESIQRYLGPEEVEWLPVDTEVVRHTYYPRSTRESFETGLGVLRLSVVLAGEDSRSLHEPEVCLPGQGWEITGTRIESVDLGQDSAGQELGSLQVKVLSLAQEVEIEGEKEILRAQYWYWWEGLSRYTPSTLERRLMKVRDAFLFDEVSRWAYPSVFGQFLLDSDLEQVGFDPAESQKRAEEQMRAALREWAPQFLRRFGAQPLSELEESRRQKEKVKPVEE